MQSIYWNVKILDKISPGIIAADGVSYNMLIVSYMYLHRFVIKQLTIVNSKLSETIFGYVFIKVWVPICWWNANIHSDYDEKQREYWS